MQPTILLIKRNVAFNANLYSDFAIETNLKTITLAHRSVKIFNYK